MGGGGGGGGGGREGRGEEGGSGSAGGVSTTLVPDPKPASIFNDFIIGKGPVMYRNWGN